MSKELMQKVAEVRPDVYEFIVKTANEIKQSPFCEEVVSEMDAIFKKADAMDLLRRAGSSLKAPAIGLGAAAGGALALSVAGDLYDAAKRGLTKGRNFSAMMKANPDLAQEDPRVVKSNFDTLHRFNPEFSSDPNVAGAYVRQGIGFGTDLETVSKLTQSRKNIRDVRSLKPTTGLWKSPEERALQSAQVRKTKAEAVRARQQAQQEYNKRMGMVPAE